MKEINLIYTVDDAYLKQVSVSLESYQINNPDSKIKVFLATEKDENTDNYQKLLKHHQNMNASFSFINCRKYDEIFKKHNLDKWGSSSYYVYWRLVAFELIDADYAIYTDSDVLCLNRLDFPDLDDKSVGCVIDSVHACFNACYGKDRDFRFYNTGTMFVDVRKWKDRQLTGKCLEFIENTDRKMLMADQDIISLALEDEIKTISPKYNWFVGYDYYGLELQFMMYELDKKAFSALEEFKAAEKETKLYHCLNAAYGRSWEDNNNSPVKDRYAYYREKSAWPDYHAPRAENILFKLELFAEKILPKNMYASLHSLATKIRIKKLTKQ